MNAIFASKLFQDSERKEDIKSALKNPMNKELVQQLSDYLDEPVEEEPEEKEEKKSNMNIKHTTKKDSNKESSDTEQPRKSNMNISRSPKPSMGEPPMDEPEEPSVEPTEDTDTVEESSCTGKTYKKSRSSIKSSIFYVPSFSVDTLIGTLQSNESTANVDRIRLKEDRELWIFYNDSVNLNDIMNDVIELINAAGYSHLEFNRLARSDNAIVFELTPESIPMQPTESELDEPEIEGVEIGEKTEE